ncbi:MAG: hypothetical protein LUH14_09165 [Clostridiaceae bacterium]|nr:hypothetical protein [Clostridiaceae bacterium]
MPLRLQYYQAAVWVGLLVRHPDSYDAATEYTADAEVDGETFESVGTDENAIHVYEGASLTLLNSVISRSSSDSTGG